MPSVTLTDVWLHTASDLTVYITFDGGTEAVKTAKPGGSLRRMGNGRVRGVTRDGDAQLVEIVAPYIERDTFDTLEDWVQAGTLLMLRDAKRRVRWGHIFGIEGPVSGHELESVSFTFECITHVEAV